MTVPGALVLVATPIGDCGDLSPRAIEELAGADVVAARTPGGPASCSSTSGEARHLLVVHDHNESQRAAAIVERLGRGERVVLISDAGLPGISDPGERVVRAVVAGRLRRRHRPRARRRPCRRSS